MRVLPSPTSRISARDLALPSMQWSGLAIGTDGRFGASDIRATFYGPNHEEVGGVFERNNIVGAFGAKRQ